MNLARITWAIVSVFIISGCAGGVDQPTDLTQNENSNVAQMSDTKPASQEPARMAKRLIKQMDEVTDVRAVNTGKQLMLSFKVKQAQRVRLKQIQNDVNNRLKDQFSSDTKVTVSTDKKIFQILEELEQDISRQKINRNGVIKRFREMQGMLKEQ